MEGEYRTVKFESSDEFYEKKSRFIGYVKNVKTKDEALEFIEKIRKKHWDATHNVYAYVLREDNIRRFSDDGEPQGTAGMPVLDVLLKEEITDCALVVTRYFGGIMLGAGGLVRAYSHGAKIALDAGCPVTMVPFTNALIKCDYSFFGKVSSLIPDRGGRIINSDFSDSVSVEFSLPSFQYEPLCKDITDASSGKFFCEKTGEMFSAIEK